MSTSNNRKLSYKLPPAVTKAHSQEARRTKALEDQKRKRAQKFDSTRQLDLFANLNLNDDSDEDEIAEEDEAVPHALSVAAVGPYVAMLKASHQSSRDPDIELTSQAPDVLPIPSAESEQPVEKKKRRKKNKKRNTNYNKPSKWADQCMYAELLEMTAEEPMWASGQDSLPQDLETKWVAVAPVPVGKRCLVVTYQSPGLGGMVPNTSLRSRLLGKSLVPRFPSPLPALTVLDCILDANWRENGIIHVLDVIRWKGQDVGDCEAPFRFWWRDTRLGEISHTVPPTINFLSNRPKHETAAEPSPSSRYQFPYPTYFVPIPYHANTSLSSLDNIVIPAARSIRSITVDVPSSVQPTQESAVYNFNFNMDVEGPSNSSSPPTFTSPAPSITLSPCPSTIRSDGLLLYVSEASYEPGTSPLSSWVPITAIPTRDGEADDRSLAMEIGPLELFHRLVKKRLDRAQLGESVTDIAMDL